MNPMQWLKAIYEAFGVPHPRISLVIVMVIFALIGGLLWTAIGKQVVKEHPASNAPSSISGPAATSGPNSPAVTGSGNSINYGQAPSSTEPNTKKRGEP